jgi:hypothetical protein
VPSDLDSRDFFTDPSLVADPYPYYDELRQCPVQREPHHGVVVVSGYDEVTIPPLDALIAAWTREWPSSNHATASVLEM